MCHWLLSWSELIAGQPSWTQVKEKSNKDWKEIKVCILIICFKRVENYWKSPKSVIKMDMHRKTRKVHSSLVKDKTRLNLWNLFSYFQRRRGRYREESYTGSHHFASQANMKKGVCMEKKSCLTLEQKQSSHSKSWTALAYKSNCIRVTDQLNQVMSDGVYVCWLYKETASVIKLYQVVKAGGFLDPPFEFQGSLETLDDQWVNQWCHGRK